LRDVFSEHGLSPISHYYMYGREEGRTPLPEPDPPGPGPVPPGNSYTLTVGEDDFTGTAHNDVFKAPAVGNGTGYTSTLESIDKLDGAGGIGTLSATLVDGPFAKQPTIDRIEIFNLRVPIAANATLDFTNI